MIKIGELIQRLSEFPNDYEVFFTTKTKFFDLEFIGHLNPDETDSNIGEVYINLE